MLTAPALGRCCVVSLACGLANARSRVGLSGHFLHGGFGFSSHKHGLALDAVVGATVVLADGSIVEASETQHPDLFWALRGAGSNFGIVASWRLKTFEAPTTLTWFSVSLGWNHSTAVAGLEALENYARDVMPRELNFRVSVYDRVNPGIEGLYYGTDAEMRAAIAPLLEKAAPLANITESHTVDWLQAAVHYGLSDNIDWIMPSPVSAPCCRVPRRKETDTRLSKKTSSPRA